MTVNDPTTAAFQIKTPHTCRQRERVAAPLLAPWVRVTNSLPVRDHYFWATRAVGEVLCRDRENTRSRLKVSL